RALAIGVENLIWFWTQDEPPQTPCDASPTDYDYMLCAGHGLYDKDGKPKKAVTAFKVFFEKTEGLTHVRALGPGNGIPEAAEGYEFSEAAGSGTGPNGARKRVWVVWVTPDITKSRPIAGKDPKANDNYTPLDITLSTKPLSI